MCFGRFGQKVFPVFFLEMFCDAVFEEWGFVSGLFFGL